MVKKAHFITGKGGVGKSLLGAALARFLSLQKQQIILTELNDPSFYKEFLELPTIGYQPSPWIEKVSVAQWSPDECLKEYALHLIKIQSLYKLFFENPISKSLIDVAPGLHELALLGKITSSPRHHGPPMPGDQLVIDSYSTGHFLSLLRAPSAMAEVIEFGPMGEQSRSIQQWITNPEFTKIHLVTLPEELPTTESIELAQQLQSEFKLNPTIYLNKMLKLTTEDLKDLPVKIKTDFEQQMQLERTCLQKLQATGLQVIELPFVTSSQTKTLITELSNVLSLHQRESHAF